MEERWERDMREMGERWERDGREMRNIRVRLGRDFVKKVAGKKIRFIIFIFQPLFLA